DVKDADGTVVKAVITLTEPEALKVDATASTFSNGYNISCFECNNGSIQVVAMQGTPPYGYTWSDGPSTAQNRYTLAPGAYKVTVTDANGCSTSTTASITQPERSDWTMSGNAGTNPA
ncbi:MAG TPA: SprB repeat-containing protein, partial [Flavobacteriales bacterium]|nr:SprB repeat-containing protein [Flavobacteriales bacterium]